MAHRLVAARVGRNSGFKVVLDDGRCAGFLFEQFPGVWLRAENGGGTKEELVAEMVAEAEADPTIDVR